MDNPRARPTVPQAAPSAAPNAKQRKNRAKKLKKRAAQAINNAGDGEEGFDDEDEGDDLPPLEDAQPISASLAQTQSDLLATANDLYRQIESAASAALVGHLPASGTGAAANQLPSLAARAAGGDENDDTYWLSLPQHLRSFIKTALPLAAGLHPPQGGADSSPSLQPQGMTAEQMQQVTQQLSEVLKSANLAGLAGGLAGSLASGELNGAGQPRSTPAAANATTTIPLGSFTVPLPLHPHPDSTEADRFEDEGEYSGDDGMGDADGAASRRKKKKKAKKATAQAPLPPPPVAPLPKPIPSRPAGRLAKSAGPPKPNAGSIDPLSTNGIAGRHAPSAAATTALSKAPVAGGSTPPPAPLQRATNSEREKIRDFWLALSEQDRRSLVKVEKEAVLRKMKEQQRHGCTCAVCGRKRNAIEEELEVLYDAYYDDMEQYALQQRRYQSSGGAIPPPPGPGPFPGSVDLNQVQAAVDKVAATAPVKAPLKTTRDHKNPRPLTQSAHHTHNGACQNPNHQHHHHHHHPAATADRGKGTVPATTDEAYESEESGEEYDDEEEEEYDEDEEYDEEEDLPPEPEPKRIPAPVKPAPVSNVQALKRNPVSSDGFLGFGDSLTVQTPGILTVADDLLKNDGQKFLEMMESLADKRIQREREVQEMYADEEDGDEGSFDGESDEERSDEDEEDDEEDEDEDEEELTEEQRMQEGRTMFQIFAARMFEQRVLQAYREKIAKERQEQLLRELEMEDQVAADREAKKAKDAQKKKDKKKAQREKAEADRLRELQVREAEENAAKAAASAKAEEERRRIEVQRVQREEQRRQKEAEAMRREEEKRKRLDEEARKRKEKEEKVKAERDARLAREREERDRKAREEAERKAKVDSERREREAAAKAAREKEEAEKREREAAEKAAKAAAEGHARTLAAQSRHPSIPSPPDVKGILPRSPSGSRPMPPSVSSPPGGSNGVPPMQKPVALPPGIPRPPSGKPMPAGPSLPSPMGMPGVAGMLGGLPQISPSNSMQQRGGLAQPMQSGSIGNRIPPAMQSPAGPSVPQYGRMGPSPMPGASQNGPSRAMGSQQTSLPMTSPASPYGTTPLHKAQTFGGQAATDNAATSPVGQRSTLPSRASFASGPPSAMLPNGVPPSGKAQGVVSPTGKDAFKANAGPGSMAALNQGSSNVSRKVSLEHGAIGSPAFQFPPHVEHGAIGPPPGPHGRRTSPPAHSRRASQQEKPSPIGRPGQRVNGVQPDEDNSAPSSSSASLREASPPPVLGSSALNEDLEDLDPSASASSSTFNESGYASSTWGSGIWAMPSLNGWNAPAPEPVSSPVDRASVLRDRTRLACQSLSHALSRPVHSFSDVFKVMVDNFPDTASVETNEILNSCAQPGNAFNGGGRFSFDQSGESILLRFDVL